MTESEARSKIKYRIEVAKEIAGNGVDGKAFEDLEIAIQALKEIREYRELGSVEEFKALKEKNVERKVIDFQINKMQSFCEDDFGRDIPCTIKSFQFYCPNCKRKIASRFKAGECPNCGQKLDWE